MDDDIEIFKGKRFSDLCKDIYDNSNTTRNQVEILISELRQLIKGVNEAITIVPMIKDYLSVGVKNDEQLVKLAAIVQRIASRQATALEVGSSFELSDHEREQLMGEVQKLTAEEKNSLSVDDVVEKAKAELKK